MDKYAKALVATLVAGLGSLQVAMLDGTVTGAEWVAVASAVVAAAGLVWAVPNAPVEPPPPTVSE